MYILSPVVMTLVMRRISNQPDTSTWRAVRFAVNTVESRQLAAVTNRSTNNDANSVVVTAYGYVMLTCLVFIVPLRRVSIMTSVPIMTSVTNMKTVTGLISKQKLSSER